MSRLISFGTYTFPDKGFSLVSNFGDAVPRTVRLPGIDGGFDLLGDDPPPIEIGRITWRYRLLADSPAHMEALRDSVRAMLRYGRAQLVMETSAGQQRYTYAKLHNVQMPDAVTAPSDRVQDVTCDFQVITPRWYADSPDSPQAEACSGTSTTFTVTNAGNAIALPAFSIDPSTAISSAGVTIQRLVDAAVVDEVEFAAALLATDVLTIDAAALTVRKNGTDAYGNTFSASHPAWMRLLPGVNNLKVILSGGESAAVTITWDDTWY